jgi:hypothetical protein
VKVVTLVRVVWVDQVVNEVTLVTVLMVVSLVLVSVVVVNVSV